MVALVVDATKSLGADNKLVITPLATEWQQLWPQSFASVQQYVTEKAGANFWDQILLPFLHLPAWIIFGVLGVLLYWAGQKRRAEEVFIN